MNYRLEKRTESIAGVTLELITLADLDQTIDALCEGVSPEDAEAVFLLERCPYFGVVWPAARALAEHLARMGGWLRDKTVLELGCGLALPSLVAAKLGAKVTCTDFHPDVPAFLDRNRAQNGVAVKYVELDWRRAPSEALGTFDFVVGSDILYEHTHPTDVARALTTFCHRGSHVVLADPGRAYLQGCVDAIRAQNFRNEIFVRQVADPRHDRAGDKPTQEVFVLVFQQL